MGTDAHEQAVIDAVPKKLFIGGEWRPAASGKTFAVEDPATGAPLCDVADGDATDATAALDAAASAQEAWAAHPPRERGEILRRTYELLTERTDELALLMTLEMGKPARRLARRDQVRGRVLPMVLGRGGAYRRPLHGRARRQRTRCSFCARPSVRACSSRHGTSRPRWARARSVRRSRRAARWSSSRPR